MALLCVAFSKATTKIDKNISKKKKKNGVKLVKFREEAMGYIELTSFLC